MSIHVVIPAGGSGSRFGSPLPKQFHTLRGRLVVEWAVAPFLARPAVAAVWIAVGTSLPPGIQATLDALQSAHGDRVRVLPCAGATRALTVAAALDGIAAEVAGDPWVLVHDAARPGLTQAALGRLLAALADEPVGALLAVPVADTLKRVGGGERVAATVPRAGLWQAQTPQAFPLGLLRRALAAAGAEAGDESSAVEALGLQPRLVEGDARNLKLTRPGDEVMIESLLAAPESACA